MRSIKFLLMTVISMFAISVSAQTADKTDSIKVYGECGMCKNRIQKTLKIDGISAASWNDETKVLVVTYDPSKITNDDIQKKIVAVGHDTEKYTAPDEVYSKLPGCCHYERKAKK